jgi:hypothetical protein
MMPSAAFPSDHALVSATLRPAQAPGHVERRTSAATPFRRASMPPHQEHLFPTSPADLDSEAAVTGWCSWSACRPRRASEEAAVPADSEGSPGHAATLGPCPGASAPDGSLRGGGPSSGRRGRRLSLQVGQQTATVPAAAAAAAVEMGRREGRDDERARAKDPAGAPVLLGR